MTTIDGIELDKTNKEFNFASEFVLHTNKLVYLTGKAGTGKTTFLKYIKESSNKNMAILAPTGVAAINARGQTIHSFFQIKPSVYVPNDIRLRTKYNPDDTDKSTIYDNFQYNKNKLSIIKGLELLIIDEISMVRCDLLDVVDRLLRVFRKREHEAFGGVQVILIGDTFQLPPIAQETEWGILEQFYKNPFFFSAKVIEENKPVYIELKKIYRQKEQDFIDLLNRVRVNQVTQNDVDKLNTKFNPVFVPHKNENYITLATHNEIVKRTNLTKLEELPSELKIFEATVTGDFPAMNMPTEKILQLKENAQIMFVKNDKGKRYFNGKIAKIIKIDEDGIVAELSENNQIIVERETWENIRFVWNDKQKKIEEEVIGTFTQYPIKLAWAITVHKSQGLTFEKVIADLNSAFAPGQVYVALSRCTTFNGLVLRTQLHTNAIKTAPEVLEFAKNEMPDTLVINELNSGKADYYYKQTRENLAKSDFEAAYNNLLKALKHRDDIETETFKRWFVTVGKRMAAYKGMYNRLEEDKEIKIQELNDVIEELNVELKDKAELVETQRTQIKELQKEMRLREKGEDLIKMIELLSAETNDRKKIADGTTGGLMWAIYDDGMLVISGKGEMPECIATYGDSCGECEYFDREYKKCTMGFDDSNSCFLQIPWMPWFDYRKSITTIVIESGVTTIKNHAFDQSPIVSITIPNSVTTIGKETFSDCHRLTSITIPNSVTSIEDFAFYFCTNLTSITIPNSVKTIGKYAFSRCGMVFVKIPHSVTKLGSSVFEGCSGLTSIIIGNNVAKLENGVFNGCGSLTSIIIGNSVTSIEEYAFYSCINLKYIHLTSITPPEVATCHGVDEVFSCLDRKNCMLHVPAGSKNEYANAEGWKDFENIQEYEYSEYYETIL